MRVWFTSAVALVILTAAAAADRPATVVADATAVLAAAREALGGEKRLSEVKSFVATGRTRQVRGNNLVPIEFVISCQLPDKYVRKDEIPAQESEPSSSGFNGDALIRFRRPPSPPSMPAMPAPGAAPPPGAMPAGPTPALAAAPSPATGAARPAVVPPPPPGPGMAVGPRPPGPPADPRKARVTTIKQDFARLTLGMFAASFSTYPLTFSLVGQAEAPQGKADVIEAKGEGTFVLKLFIHSDTHLPLMVSWTVPATNAVVTAPGQPAPGNLAPGTVVVQGPPAPPATASKTNRRPTPSHSSNSGGRRSPGGSSNTGCTSAITVTPATA